MAGYNLIIASYVARQRWVPTLGLGRFPDFTNTIYYFFVLAAWTALYFGIQAYLDLVAERERLLRAEGLAHRARLQALRLQLNPHFLFNTLNAVSTLVAESRSSEANRMISRLSGFLRHALDHPDIDEVPLAEEIGFVREYLEIEGVRFGNRLRVELSVAPNAEDALVPAMILQPLVENAVRHGVLAREDGGMIVIQAVREGQSLRLEVHDDGPGVGAIEAVNAGVGLSNTRERLAELYGTNAELLLSRSGHGGLEASIRLPYRVATQGTA
jgi:two-component system LytT family sensor kinase